MFVSSLIIWIIKKYLAIVYNWNIFDFLQAAQMIMELQEASQINQGLQPTNVSRTTTVVHDMKAIVKTWKLVSNILCPSKT